jgi:hypothetical protein
MWSHNGLSGVEAGMMLTCGCRWRHLVVSRHVNAVYHVSQFGYAVVFVMA